MKRLTLYPAIDLKDGACVRLARGDMDRATLYAADPAAQALAWQEVGCAWLHVVDLNGAFAGRPVNADAVRAILSAVSIPVQLGGGIRNMDTIAMWLDGGVSRVILGSAAVRDPALVREACARFPGRIVIGIDARDGRVAVEGWTETSSLEAEDLAIRVQDAGASAIVYTDISRDGMLSGLQHSRYGGAGAPRVGSRDCVGRGFRSGRSARAAHGGGRDRHRRRDRRTRAVRRTPRPPGGGRGAARLISCHDHGPDG